MDEIFSASHLKPSFVELYGQTYPVLPPTENVFYMLHHMLKHYLYSGFGSRLLCDFTLYLERYASRLILKNPLLVPGIENFSSV